MPDNDNPPSSVPPSSVPSSKVVPKRRTRLSVVWLIPIVAMLAGVWVAATQIMGRGPKITIVFPSAEGLEANKTKIRYAGLEVGTLTEIRLAEDHHSVIATAQMDPKAREFLVKDTTFWVVRPRISGLNISGLSTLISGDYIGTGLGTSKEKEEHFVALDEPPLVTGDAAGRMFVLKAKSLGSIDSGTPILFRQVPAGQVVSYELDKEGHFLNISVFVKAPFDKLVTANTRFWRASGINMSLGADGLQIQTESVMSILAGGISFETPAEGPALPPAAAQATFELFGDRQASLKPLPHDPQEYRVVFKDSVRGLIAGAPVQVNGITIGEVTEVQAEFDERTMTFTVPVIIRMDPQRYGVKLVNVPPGSDPATIRKSAMDSLVSHGLRAQLRSGNLLTGALYVALDFFPETPPAQIDWSGKVAEMPTVPGKFEGMEASISGILTKLNQMDFKAISEELRQTIADADKALVALRGTIGGVDRTVDGFGKTMASVDDTLATLRASLAGADRVMTNADKLLNTADKLVGPNSDIVLDLGGLLREAGNAAKALRQLADYLERHPEALIQGKDGKAK